MGELRFEPVVFETPEFFDVDIALQISGYEVIGSFSFGGITTKHYFHPSTLNKLTISENLNENKLAV